MSQKTSNHTCKSKSNSSHLTLEKRRQLFQLLQEQKMQKEIAIALSVHPTTITREILAHRVFVQNRRKYVNPCLHYTECNIRRICKNIKCIYKCKNCPFEKKCGDICPNFEPLVCKRIERFPYVCNGCTKARKCVFNFYRYDPEQANNNARLVLVNSRRGINMTEEEFINLDHVLTKGLSQGQSVEHIAIANKLTVSTRTIRNYISQGLTTVKPADMPRCMAYKPRKQKISKEDLKNARTAKVGRDYASFLRFANTVPFLQYTQIDTVEGSKAPGDNARLLTFILVKYRFFYSVPIPDGKFNSVLSAINTIYKKIGHDDFLFFFGVLLTDNGSEFSRPQDIEKVPDSNEIRSKVFFCNPYSFWEKGGIEVCHELLRRIIPKGSTLAHITLEKARKINSHINSYTRGVNGSISAYDTLVAALGDRATNFLKKLHVERIPGNEVTLHPSLIR